MEANAILSTLVSIVGILVLLLYRGNDKRITALELTVETKDNANAHRLGLREDLAEHATRDEQQFLALQVALREFRIETREQFTSLRNEANEKRTEVRNDLITQRAETGAQLTKLYDLLQNGNGNGNRRMR